AGAAVSLVDPEEIKLLKAIERLIKREIPRAEVKGFVAPAVTEPEAPRPPKPQRSAAPRREQGRKRNAPDGARQHPGHSPAKRRQRQSQAARQQAMQQPALFSPQQIARRDHRGR